MNFRQRFLTNQMLIKEAMSSEYIDKELYEMLRARNFSLWVVAREIPTLFGSI